MKKVTKEQLRDLKETLAVMRFKKERDYKLSPQELPKPYERVK